MRNAYLELLESQDAEAVRNDKIIQQFCKAWLEWVDAGISRDKGMFSKSIGLCGSLMYWMIRNGYTGTERLTVLNTMYAEFRSKYGTASYPFSEPYDAVDSEDPPPMLAKSFMYVRETCGGTVHRNKRRLAWAREKAAMLAEENV